MQLIVQQYVVRLEIAMQNSCTMSIDQCTANFASNPDGFFNADAPASKKISKRTVFDILHHEVRWLGIPANIQQAYDVARCIDRCELFDFAAEHRPVESSSVRIKLDRNHAARAIFASQPDGSVGSGPKSTNDGVAFDFCRGLVRLQAKPPRPFPIVVILDLGIAVVRH